MTSSWKVPALDPATLRFLARVAAGLGLYAVISRGYHYAFYHGFNLVYPRLAEIGQAHTRFDFSFLKTVPYEAPFMLGVSMLHPIFGPLLIASAVLPFLAYRDLAWHKLRSGKLIRAWIGFLVGILTWAFITYDYNLYVDHAHHPDRILLLAFAVLTWRHPAFLSLFLPHCLLMMSQFNYPLHGLSLTDKSLLLSVLLVFQTFLYLRALGSIRGLAWIRRRRNEGGLAARALGHLTAPFSGLDSWFFLYLALCSIGNHYFVPAIAKLLLSPHGHEWIWQNEFVTDTVFTFERGWLSQLSDTTLSRIVSLMAVTYPALLLGTVLIEAVAILLVVKRSITIWLLALFAAFHGIIMVFAGVFFWKWMVLEIGLIAVFLRLDGTSVRRLYQRRAVWVSFVVIAASYPVFQPVALAWWDTRYHTMSRIEVIGESGEHYLLDKSFMDPYEMFFAFDYYHFLNRKPMLFIGSWTLDYDLMIEVQEVGAEGIRDLVRRQGRPWYDEEKSAKLYEFMRRFFARLNQRGHKEVLLSHLAAPHHIFMYERGKTYALQEPVEAVRFIFYQQYWDGEKVILLDETHVGPIQVPAFAGPPN